jgi:pyruvate/2-oxoglutarate dehydrogenase complex dihydrolipoamide acyltransferase (E2) component
MTSRIDTARGVFMITKVVLPKWGMGIEEGTVVRWLKNIGERVRQGEPLVEIETAKATQEVEAPAAGTLIEILVAEGQVTTVNSELAVIEDQNG